MKQSTKWFMTAIIRYFSLWGCCYIVSHLIILMTMGILRMQGIAISSSLDSTIILANIIIFALIATKLEKRIKFYQLFGFAPGKSAKKQIATWKKINELGFSVKDISLRDAINHLKLHESITKIKGVELNDGGKKTRELTDFFSAILLADHFKIEQPLENNLRENESS